TGDAPTIPLDAKVTIQELGRYMETDVRDGSYSVIVPKGTYTLQSEAYGYLPATEQVEVGNEEAVTKDFSLQPIPEGTVTGIVTDQQTGEPITDATLLLMEDAAITPVTTDEDGNYNITAYEGDYTLRVIKPNYHIKDVSIHIDGKDD